MAVVARLWTVGDPVHETARRWFGKMYHGAAWALHRGVWMLAGACLAVVLGVPYMTRSLEKSCQRVRGPEVEAVLLRHGAQRTETLPRHVERMAPLVAKGIMKAEDLQKEEGWLVCETFLPAHQGR